MALRAEAYPTWASTSTSTTADSLLILTTGSVQVILTTQNCPGRLHIHVCIIPCAKLSTANRLIPFSQQATPPPASLSRSSTNTCPPPSVYPTTTIPPGSHSIRPTDSVYSGASARPSTMSHPLQLDTTHMNPAVARAASVSDPCRYLCLRVKKPSFFRSAHTMPGLRRDRSSQLQDRTRYMSATASSHAHARSSISLL
jgi:hypothetical protein